MNSYGLIDWLLDRLINWFIDWSIETHTFYLVCVSERTSFTCLFREMLACDVIVTSCHRLCTAIVSVYGKCSTRQKKKKIFYRRNVILSRVPGKRFVTRRFFSSSPQIQRVSKQVKKPSASQQVNLYQTSQSSRARINQLRNFSTDALKAVSNTETYDMQCNMI